MDRRAFFTRGAGKVAQKVTQHAAQKARENAARWIRPPFAIEELDFLLACDRCGDCVRACPKNIIFPLSSKLGIKVFNTPAMDLVNHACHLCEDWPCVQVCEKDALKLPEQTSANIGAEKLQSEIQVPEENKPREDNQQEIEQAEQRAQRMLPKIAVVSINTKTCLPYSGPECGACRVCPVAGAMTWYMEKPDINESLCTGCAQCREACIVEPKAINVQSKYKT